MATRTIDGPEENTLTMEDLEKLMGLSESAIRRLIKGGLFPEAAKIPNSKPKWLWTDIVWWQLTLQIRSRLTPPVTPSEHQRPPNDERDELAD